MSFVDTIKNEILSKPIKERHCRLAFLAGLIRGTGSLFEKDGDIGLEIKVGSELLANFVSDSLRILFNYQMREVAVGEDKLNKKDKFLLNIFGDNSLEILKQLEIIKEEDGELSVNFNFYGELTKKECCLRAFIRGLFVAIGTCTIPTSNEKTSTGYHLELDFSHYTPAIETSSALAQFNVLTKITRRKEHFILYIKSAEEIKDFLAFLPAPLSVLKITDLMINREISNYSNRQKNCDLGNVNKQVEAAQKQIQAIDKIILTIGLDALKEDDKKVSLARKEYPDLTLNELANKLNISKSCLNHKLRKIVAIANEL